MTKLDEVGTNENEGKETHREIIQGHIENQGRCDDENKEGRKETRRRTMMEWRKRSAKQVRIRGWRCGREQDSNKVLLSTRMERTR